MSRKAGLGRDFYSILDDNLNETRSNASSSTLRISSIEPRSDQPRKDFDHEQLEILSESIGQYGVLQPIIVRENPNFEGSYEIIAGERRWRAAKMAGLTEIPAIVMDSDDLLTAQVSLIENIQREDLNAVEEALAYQTLIDRFGLTQEQLAKQVGKERSTITNAIRMLDLPEAVLDMLKKGDLSSGHAKVLLSLKNPQIIKSFAEKVIEKDLSVRETEQAVKAYLRQEQKGNNEKEADLDDSFSQKKVYMKDLEERVFKKLDRRVKITNTGKKKVLELTYQDDQDLEDLLKQLCGQDFFA